MLAFNPAEPFWALGTGLPVFCGRRKKRKFAPFSFVLGAFAFLHFFGFFTFFFWLRACEVKKALVPTLPLLMRLSLENTLLFAFYECPLADYLCVNTRAYDKSILIDKAAVRYIATFVSTYPLLLSNSTMQVDR
jgi:hypothetical protein